MERPAGGAVHSSQPLARPRNRAPVPASAVMTSPARWVSPRIEPTGRESVRPTKKVKASRIGTPAPECLGAGDREHEAESANEEDDEADERSGEIHCMCFKGVALATASLAGQRSGRAMPDVGCGRHRRHARRMRGGGPQTRQPSRRGRRCCLRSAREGGAARGTQGSCEGQRPDFGRGESSGLAYRCQEGTWHNTRWQRIG